MANVTAPLTREEWVACLKDKIDLDTRKRLETAMANKKPNAYTWPTVSKQDIKDLLCAEFGLKESKVSEVLIQFGPNRYKKPNDMGVATFYHRWAAQLPGCMRPSTADENRDFVDLIKRSLFLSYLSARRAL